MTNTKLTDERPDDEALEMLITMRRETAERYAADGYMAQCAMHTLILNAFIELQERRKADNQEPAGYHVIKECGQVGCSVETLDEAEKTRDFWNKKWTIRPYFYTAPPVPVVPEECPAELLAFCEQVIDSRITANAKADELWNACCAAMLQGSQPVSNRDELPVQ